jgi:hypothetical protein
MAGNRQKQHARVGRFEPHNPRSAQIQVKRG